MQNEIKKAKDFYHRNNKVIDYIALTLKEKVDWAIYTNDLVAKDETALNFLYNNMRWKFLIENDLILFYTTKKGEDILYSYEYKLKKLSNGRFDEFLKNWENSDEKKAIEYFSQVRKLGKYENGGVWFFGIEQKKHQIDDVLKVYFKAFYENENGEALFDEKFGNVIKDCGLLAMKTIMHEVEPLLQYGFHLYMVGWNYDFITKTSKYKVYCRANNNCDRMQFLHEIAKKFPELKFNLLDFEREQGLYLEGFCYGMLADQVSVNLYYKEKL